MDVATLDATAARLARLLTAGDDALSDGTEPEATSLLEFEADLELHSLIRSEPPAEVWAVDGGQGLVADARCLQVLVTRASRVAFRGRRSVLEDEGELRVHLLGGRQNRLAVESLRLGLSPETSIDANLIRDRWEWDAVSRSIDEAADGAFLLIDGDLQPDWRVPSGYLGDVMERARAKGVTLAGVTKHSSLSRGGAPLLGHLERSAAAAFGPRSLWWCRVGRTRLDVSPGFQVLVARLDPDARFAFRVDLPLDADPASSLGVLGGLCDDAAFPGYPYPLTVADRLAACPGWLRTEMWMALDEALEGAGVDEDVRERAFADRHRLMERA